MEAIITYHSDLLALRGAIERPHLGGLIARAREHGAAILFTTTKHPHKAIAY